jgi:oligoendopeptidase F
MTLAYDQKAWSLQDLYPSHKSSEMEEAFEAMKEKVGEFEGLRARLTPDIEVETFLDMVRQLDDLSSLANKVYSYAGLWFNAETQNQDAQNFVAKVDQFLAGIQNRMLFFTLWWKGLEDDQAERLKADAGKYAYWLEEMRLFKPHTLSEPEEKIINIKNVTGQKALNTLYDTITNRYVFRVEVEGEVKELTRGQLMVYVRNADPDLRARAYQELYRVYEEDSTILGQIYQTTVRDWRNEHVDLRKFATPIAARNLTNTIPDEVVDTLLDVCRQNAEIFQRFFRLKARWLGVERLRRYDIYAPTVTSDKTYEFGEAAEMVLESFNSFDPDIGQRAQRVFDENHLDSEVRKGKRDGAFCWSVTPSLTPWVLLNYQGRSDDVATMAHELGHAIHSMLASDQTVFTFHATLPLAETASTFGEMMLVDRLMEAEKDESVRRDLLFRQMDDAYATIMRQAYFALFERKAHEMVSAGASIEDLTRAYLENLNEQFGEAVELSEEFRWEWTSIPHIYHTPFYVYAYAFGQLLVLSLYQQYKNEGERFKPRYKKILSAGSSDSPADILEAAGIDIRSAAFWQGGFDVLRGTIEQLEEIPVS